MFDILSFAATSGGVLAIIRAGIIYGVILYFYTSEGKLSKRLFLPLIFFLYVLITVIFSSEILKSLQISLRVMSGILAIGIGYEYIRRGGNLSNVYYSLYLCTVILGLNFIVSTLLGIGNSVYTGGDTFLVGNLDDNWNLYTYTLIFFPLVSSSLNKRKNVIYIIFSIFNFIVLLMSLKRIAIAGILLLFILMLLLYKKKASILKYSILSFVIVVVASPLYIGMLIDRMEARSRIFESDSYEKEYRYLETFYVWDKVYQFDNPLEVIFGLEGFNSTGNYANGRFGDRQLHVDYNLIPNTIGIFGMFLYVYMFTFYFNKSRIYINRENILTLYPPLILVLLMFTSIAGQMYLVTFRSIGFLLFGALFACVKRN